MSILKEISLLGKKKCFYKKVSEKRCKIKFFTLELKLPAAVGATTNKIFCTKVHISPGEKYEFLELGKGTLMCSHTSRITF